MHATCTRTRARTGHDICYCCRCRQRDLLIIYKAQMRRGARACSARACAAAGGGERGRCSDQPPGRIARGVGTVGVEARQVRGAIAWRVR